VSFNVEARKVRDRTLPYGARVGALCHCLEMYSPIGYQDSWQFLEARVGTFRKGMGHLQKNDAALLAALELIEQSRRVCLVETAAYAQLRREQKAEGRRVPKRGDVTAFQPPRWHADPAGGALYVLQRVRPTASIKPIDAHSRRLYELVDVVLQEQALSPAMQQELAELARDISAGLEDLYRVDPRTYQHARHLLRDADHIRVATGDY
jgi:hypothetical protein